MMLPSDTIPPVQLLLGTAMWGWTVSRPTCFDLLDTFYAAGFRQVDAAVNYPINKNPDDFRAAEHILLEWINTHGIRDLKITMKLGSLNNLRSPEHNLSKSFLLLNLDDYRYRLGSNWDTLMVHWDNSDAPDAIAETLEALAISRNAGLRIGLSGIRHPDLYARLNAQVEFNFDFHIQIKHNFLQSDYARYSDFHGSRRFSAYGIHAGGIKPDASAYRPDSSLAARGGNVQALTPEVEQWRQLIEKQPRPLGFHEAAMMFAAGHPDIESIVVGPSSQAQLLDTINVWKNLDYAASRALYSDHATSRQNRQ
jgi:aryl-alcohol dehydrogenase-like predicted oxidoreductase